ncbi:MAG TPA: hypothetical protein VGS41_15840, partial [Chthonomonadales bacterium]|nr:hypothetical protein [Chthonomonadales bacterium]
MQTAGQPAAPDFYKITRGKLESLSIDALDAILDEGRDLASPATLQTGGALLFPHAGIETCGKQIAAAVHSALDSGAERVLALGVLHARTPELQQAREREAAGGNPAAEPSRGVQGPGLTGRQDWRQEFSLLSFEYLWNRELERRAIEGPALSLRYPYLAGGDPEQMPGISELSGIAREGVIVATMDPFHHGLGYGDAEA